jgi:hypothetical protein
VPRRFDRDGGYGVFGSSPSASGSTGRASGSHTIGDCNPRVVGRRGRDHVGVRELRRARFVLQFAGEIEQA